MLRWLMAVILPTCLGCQGSRAATIDTVLTYSQSMHKNIKAVIVRPKTADARKAYPVVYLLHGYSGSYSDWIRKVPAISDYADRYGFIIVCADGNFGSWYFDSPVDTAWKYETYVSKELVSYVDEHYPTIRSREGRAITGLSMGGHGALFLSFRHQDVYGAAGSMSGGVDMRPFPNSWDIARRLGSETEFPQRWEAYSVISQTNLLKPGGLRIIFDCGTEDFFYAVNTQLHEKLLAAKIPHDFISRPGSHDWDYWGNAVEVQLLFFSHYFEKSVK